MNAGALARLSVVVPVGPGDALCAELRAQLGALPRGAEVHVVHVDGAGGPSCGSQPIDPGDGPQWHALAAPAGRARQQNAGANAASGDWLWFLHADSRLAPRTLPALADWLHADTPALGYFDLRFLDDGPAAMCLNTFGAHIRSRWLGLPFGDQGLVLPRSVFHRLGGFDERVSGGEDHDLVWRVRRAGVRVRPLRAPLYTSARKYARHGWMRTTAWHLAETWRQARAFSRARGDA